MYLRIGDDFDSQLARRPPGAGGDRARQHAPGCRRSRSSASRTRCSATASRSARCACSRAASIPAWPRRCRSSHKDLSTPEARKGMAMSFLPYLLILSAFLGGAYLIIDTTAGERERQSLEPLLATPASRGAIVSGKIAAACAGRPDLLLLTLLAFKLGAQFTPGRRPADGREPAGDRQDAADPAADGVHRHHAADLHRRRREER